MENVVAVLSDLRTNTSYVYYGGFSRELGIGECGKGGVLTSIWEEDIFSRIHPDDLADKHLHELCFLNFIKGQPRKKRGDYYLTSRLRMKNSAGGYIPVAHRMFYVSSPSGISLWLALSLYGPMMFDFPAKCVILDSATGRMIELSRRDGSRILSAREKQVLNLIDRGMTSKEIARELSISVHTVSRHRQEILGKLQVKNSIEACRIAKDMGLLAG